jgi:hypothetical protein
MSDERNEQDTKAGETDRRTFIKGAAATGLLGAVGMASLHPQSTEAAQSGQETNGQVPRTRESRPAIGPAMDMRNPESYAAVPDATRVVMDHFKALSQRDLKGVADTLHFPYGTFEQTDAVVVNAADDLMRNAPASLNMTTNPQRFTDHDGYINPGSYDVFGGIEVFNADPVQVNLAMSYDRFSPSGDWLLRCDGVYCVTNNDGKWAIQLMSTIFTPGRMVGTEFSDSVAAAKRLREIHTWSFQTAWQPGVWANVRQLGRNLGIRAARDAYHGFATGSSANNVVKNRLQVSDFTQERLDAISTDFKSTREKWKALGLGNWGWDWGAGPPARVVHQSVNKVHMYQGASRFTAGGEFISNSEEIDVVTLVHGRWGLAGILGYIMNHDRSIDAKNIVL